MIDTLRVTAEEAMGLVERGEASGAELHAAYLDAIRERDGELHAYLRTVDEADGAGVPIAFKDLISTKGVETTAGSKILSGYVPVFDSTVAARCREAGLPLLGKTNMDEFAMGSSTENSAFGPTRNPWDPERVPGGSSGGSAAAVAAGLAPWALGSDTGGSVKQPASLCGIVGLRPTYGTVSRYGIVAFASSLDQIGPMTKTVRDNALLYRIVAGRDPCDTTTVDLPEPVEIPEREDLKGVRVGVPRELNEAEGIEPGVKEAVDKTIELCRELGAEVGETSLPRSVDYGLACYYLVAPAEASSNLARYDGARYGLRVDGANVREMYEKTRDAGFGDEPKRRIMLGAYALSAGLLRRLLRPGAESPNGDRTGARRRLRAVRRAGQPDLAHGRVQARREGREPTRDVPLRRADDPVEHGRPAGALHSLRTLGRSAGRLPADRPAVLGEPALPHRPRARAGDRLRLRPGEAPMTWEPVIGLEIHIHLKTRTKMFCRCEVAYSEAENTRTCPVCLAFPGSLPVPNAKAVEWTVKLGLALDCRIAERAIFHRKNYFYPDNPKAYQISQYDEPLCLDGRLVVPGESDKEVGIVRAHLEEDAAKNVHLGTAEGRISGASATLVDFNRAGTPLVEIVTQPDLRSAEEARRFLQLLRQTVVELGISDAEMEKGSLRFDVNVSVRPEGSDELRTRTELKNLNSFAFAARAIEREVERQIGVYEAGGEVEQETLHFDPGKESAPPLRSKEEAQDYRYFPEPDLVPIEPPAELVERARAELPELPGARIHRLASDIDHATAADLVTSGRDALYERVPGDRRAVANVLMNQFAASGVDPGSVDADELGKLIEARSRIPRDRFLEALGKSGEPSFSADAYLGDGLVADTSELEPIVDRILEANPGQVESYRGGKEGLLGFFVGQVMRETQGKADPKVVNDLLRQKLSAWEGLAE